MRKILIILFVLNVNAAFAQRTENIIIITTDGLRWQEVFAGMDSAIEIRSVL